MVDEPSKTSPLAPSLRVTPWTTAGGPPLLSDMLSTLTACAVPEATATTNVWLPKAKVDKSVLRADTMEGSGPSVDIVAFGRTNTRPLEPWLITLPLMVAFDPPAESVVPAIATAFVATADSVSVRLLAATTLKPAFVRP